QSTSPSAQSIAGNDSDFSGMTKCPESGSWDDYLKAEQQSDPTTYETDKKDWDQMKASGADDGYVAAYAQNSSECAIFSTDTPPKGKVTYVFVVRFKDQTAAEASYKTSAKDFHVSDSDLADVKAAGGTVTQGSATGADDRLPDPARRDSPVHRGERAPGGRGPGVGTRARAAGDLCGESLEPRRHFAHPPLAHRLRP